MTGRVEALQYTCWPLRHAGRSEREYGIASEGGYIMRERGIGSIREESEEFGSIREAIDWMAETRGEAVFLISAETGRVLTFEGLQQQSRATSARLREAGLEHGDKVAFLMDNGLFTAQLFLGTMYGGFVSVPLNVRAGVSQLSYMLEHCDAKIVFVASQYASLIKEVMTDVRRSIEVISADIDGFYQENEVALRQSTSRLHWLGTMRPC